MMKTAPHAWPQPDQAALTQSAMLLEHIQENIRQAGGWISFARYMELALYTPGLGYYSGASHKFGTDGDFITAPEISPLFGQALARQVAQVLAHSAANVLEVGAGTGALAADMLAALAALGHLPDEYCILELSGDLRARQAATLQARVPTLAARVRWLDAWPEHFKGCVVANELLDVIPVMVAYWEGGAWHERGISRDENQLVWQNRPWPSECPLPEALRAGEAALPDGYQTEVCPSAQAWIRAWEQRLGQGALILIDYGYPSAEFYLPSRSAGTVQCYYRHRAHTEFFRWPGLNDITAFVDFTAMAEAGFAAGLDVAGYTSQASFLLNCGVLEDLAARGPTDSADYLRAARALQRLIGNHEMGEVFKVLALTRGLEVPLIGFSQGDRTHTL